MVIGKVVDTVLSTRKHESLQGCKLLLVELLPQGSFLVAGDTLGAGVGEYVLITRGMAAQQALEKDAPVDAMVSGILDNAPSFARSGGKQA